MRARLAFNELIRKDSVTHVHDLAVYVNVKLPFERDSSLEISQDSYLFSTGLIH